MTVIRLKSRTGKELRVSSDAQAKVWERQGYKRAEAPAKRSSRKSEPAEGEK